VCVCVRHEWGSPDNCNVILSQCLAKDLMHIAILESVLEYTKYFSNSDLFGLRMLRDKTDL